VRRQYGDLPPGARHLAEGELDDPVGYAWALVEATLERLGPAAVGLVVHDITPSWPLSDAGDLLITFGPADARRRTDLMGVHFSVTAPLADATVVTVGQVQDHVVELTHGAAVPPCPDHRHPLQAVVVAGTASWVCPHDPGHHTEPIAVR
jgi:hypothetical protein